MSGAPAAGVKDPLVKQASPVRWFEREPSFYNDQETFVVASLVKLSDYATCEELQAWALQVVEEKTDTTAWKATKNGVAEVHLPLWFACTQRIWTQPELEQVAKAMQVGTAVSKRL